VISSGCTSGMQQICGQRKVSSNLMRFGFFICMVNGGQGFHKILVIFVLAERTRLSSYLVILDWLGGIFFPSEFLKLTRLHN
jgi:hypothetical protein